MKTIIFLVLTSFNLAYASSNCSKVGDMSGGSTVDAQQCCKGLTYSDKYIHEHIKDGCKQFPPAGSWGTCIKCGDEKCDSQSYENKCNCPKDCK